MVSNKKLSKKELKRPDKFKQRGMEIIQTLMAQKVMVSLIFLGSAAVVFAIVGIDYFKEQKRLELDNALAEINKIYDEEMTALSTQKQELGKKIQELEKQFDEKSKALLTTSQPKDKNQGQNPTEKDQNGDGKSQTPADNSELKKLTEQKEALEKQQTDLASEHAQSKPKYLEFFKKHPDTPQGQFAALRVSQINIANQSYDDAIANLEELRKIEIAGEYLETLVHMNLIQLYEEKKNYDQAMAVINAFETKIADKLKPKLLLAKSRILFFQNQNDKAISTIDTILNEHSESSEAKKALAFKVYISKNA